MMVSPPIYQDCIRCHKPLTPESLHVVFKLDALEKGEPLAYVYKHAVTGCKKLVYSVRPPDISLP